MAVGHMPRNDYLFTAGFDGCVGVWDVTQRRTVRPRLDFMFNTNEGESSGNQSPVSARAANAGVPRNFLATSSAGGPSEPSPRSIAARLGIDVGRSMGEEILAIVFKPSGAYDSMFSQTGLSDIGADFAVEGLGAAIITAGNDSLIKVLPHGTVLLLLRQVCPPCVFFSYVLFPCMCCGFQVVEHSKLRSDCYFTRAYGRGSCLLFVLRFYLHYTYYIPLLPGDLLGS